jgi:glucose/arabinose dehydrogenase
VGYKVAFVPFKNGKPSGSVEDFLTGFLTGHENDAYGRSVGLAFSQDGSLPFADDAATPFGG